MPSDPTGTAACSHAGFHGAMSMQCRECGYQPGPATTAAAWLGNCFACFTEGEPDGCPVCGRVSRAQPSG